MHKSIDAVKQPLMSVILSKYMYFVAPVVVNELKERNRHWQPWYRVTNSEMKATGIF